MRYYRRPRKEKTGSPIAAIVILALVTLAAENSELIGDLAIGIALLAALAVCGWLIVRVFRFNAIRGITLSEIDQMSPSQFEDYIGLLFRMKGCRAEVTKRSGDYGADVIVRGPKGNSIAVQVKHSTTMRSIGPKAVQEVVAALGYYRCKKAIVVSNSYYTRGALELARKNRVELWDRERLAKEIRSTTGHTAPAAQAALALSMGSSADDDSMTCPLCGNRLELRSGHHGLSMGCAGYPQCKYTRGVGRS